ncbi:MAG: hypothetical protein KKE93_03515 [Nanoarchaeota archaeon]|nr:hypothetical protein [Nanoarchaeota archaeon]
MTNFVELFEIMESWGMLDVMLPFLLIFTVVFAVLQKANIFGTDSKRFNVVIALVLGMVVVIPHIMGTYPEGKDAVLIINSALPNVALVLIAIIMVLLLSGVFGYEPKGAGGAILIPAFAVIIYIFGVSAGWWSNFSWFNIDPDTLAIILVLLVFGIIIAIITSGEETFKPLKGLMNIFKGNK